jgi:hypothetical protein
MPLPIAEQYQSVRKTLSKGFIFATDSVAVFVKSYEKAKRPRVAPNLAVEVKIITDFEADK